MICCEIRGGYENLEGGGGGGEEEEGGGWGRAIANGSRT